MASPAIDVEQVAAAERVIRAGAATGACTIAFQRIQGHNPRELWTVQVHAAGASDVGQGSSLSHAFANLHAVAAAA